MLRRMWPAPVLIILAAAAAVAAEPSTITIEDWSRQVEGKTGVPDGWKSQYWGSPKYDFTVITEGGNKILRLRSEKDSSTISKEVKVDVKRFPILEWRWKAVILPRGADVRRKETDDQAAQIYVTFPRFPSAVRSRIIGYIWDTAAPVGAVIKSEKGSAVTYLVVRSGEADLGRWLTQTRNVYDDYKKIYGEEPGEEVRAVSICIDSDDTRSRAESHVGEILFRKL